MWFEDFQDGCHDGHFGYQNGTILAILNLHAALMPSIKSPLYPTYCSGADKDFGGHHEYDSDGNVKNVISY